MCPEGTDQFFEGAEKLLEIWFSESGEKKGCDLKKIPRKHIQSMLKLAHCEVVSFSNNGSIDAYILSESSLFVAKRRFILKTCGTTNPLKCIQSLMFLSKIYSGYEAIEKVFYSHKNFQKPAYQNELYRDFEKEMKHLNRWFGNSGTQFCMKCGNEDDAWYLYVFSSANGVQPSNSTKVPLQPDQTLEICMSELDPEIMAIFTKENSSSASEATKKSGIDQLIPEMRIDEILFHPCGYSMNGIMKDGSYMTIHITPEPLYSYVSFETNIPFPSYQSLITKVLDIFKPGKFIVSIFANKDSVALETPSELKKMKSVGNWQQLKIEMSNIASYDLGVAFYSKFPS